MFGLCFKVTPVSITAHNCRMIQALTLWSLNVAGILSPAFSRYHSFVDFYFSPALFCCLFLLVFFLSKVTALLSAQSLAEADDVLAQCPVSERLHPLSL